MFTTITFKKWANNVHCHQCSSESVHRASQMQADSLRWLYSSRNKWLAHNLHNLVQTTLSTTISPSPITVGVYACVCLLCACAPQVCLP